MTEIHEFTKESQARAFWHHLVDQMGFERMNAQCSISLKGGIYTITIQR